VNKIQVQVYIKPKWLSIFMLAFIPWFSGCTTVPQAPKPPIFLPFNVQKAGNKVETEMRIEERKQYSFRLRFAYKKNDLEDDKRVRKLTGDSRQRYENRIDVGISTPMRFKIGEDGKAALQQDISEKGLTWIDSGIPTPLRFKINVIDNEGEKLLLEQDIPIMGLTSWGSGILDKIFAQVILNPGHYRVSVESLKDAPELVGTKITFCIDYRMKI
jgi:hypothetical protein